MRLLYTRLLEQLRATPGVQSVAAMSGLPPVRRVDANDTNVEGYTPPASYVDMNPANQDAPNPLFGVSGCTQQYFTFRDLLKEVGLSSWVKTSGSKGFHIAVPLDGKANMGEVEGFAHALGRLLVSRDPKNLTQEFHKVDRGTRILVDTGRNGWSATHAAAYAVRAKPGAPVSAPCTWEELETGKVGPRTFTLRNMAPRIEQVGDLWSGMRRRRRSLNRPLLKLRALSRGR